MRIQEISGNWATLLLPVAKDDSIDFGRLAEEIDVLVSTGVDGIYSNGTAGEFYNQTEDEFDRVSELLAVKCARAGKAFQLGCSHMSPTISLQRIRRAKQLFPSGIQVILPDWWVTSYSETVDFLAKVIEEAAPVGVILYNPPHAKKQLSPLDFHRLKEDGIVLSGCKVAGGDEQWYASMRKFMAHLSVFIPGHYMATGIKNGAQGSYSNVACLHPEASQKWYEQIKTDMKDALELEARIQHFMQTYIAPYLENQGFSNQAADKFLAAIGGWAPIGTRLRWPYASIPEEEVPRVRRAAKQLIPEFIFSKP